MKQVSVLFCDIVNSTPLTERLGPERMRDLVHGFLEKSTAEVRRYDGTAPQFTGDGFMALFGAPLTYEDHVRRALLAALAIHGALGENNEADRQRLDLQVRIGIHTGPVVFGPIGHQSPMDYTAIGDTANVAARVQQAAEPGTILLSEATWLHAKDFARVEPVGPLTLKGKDEPILACRLLGVSHRRAGLRESNPAHTTAFVNRESELSILNNFLRQVESGCSQAIGVVGEPGIGKSRLLAEFRWGLADGRITWVEGRCLSYGTAIPYLLVLDLLRSNCEIVETDGPTRLQRRFARVCRRTSITLPDVELVEHAAKLRPVGLGSARHFAEHLARPVFPQFRYLSRDALAVRSDKFKGVGIIFSNFHCSFSFRPCGRNSGSPGPYTFTMIALKHHFRQK
jgi:class 3 adenylate cyclase